MSKKNISNPAIIGGGPKKILYTLNTVGRIGLLNSAKALTSHNTCKACGLGMGGQRGGMTNEMDEFPSVCNKSIQAQSTDIQPPIPEEVFNHSLEEFKKLSGKEMESLGRLNTPLYKSAGSNQYKPVEWSWALEKIADGFTATPPEKSFFYSSGRSSNEAGFVLQLFARMFGTNNVNNCSYYCHQATGVGLANTIGTGTATVELEDLNGCDLIFVIGANPASNHPRFIHKLMACRDRGGHVIVINPAKEPGLVRFAVPKSPKSLLKGGSWIASHYLQPRIGTDVLVMMGIAKAVLAQQSAQIDQLFIESYTENFSAYQQSLVKLSWREIEKDSGISQSEFVKVAECYAGAKNAVFAWGMGITHHTHGVENVEAISNLALLRGMMGKRHAGLLPLRGHSNVQGIGTIGVRPVLAQDVFEKIETHFGVTLPQEKGMDTLACLTEAHAGNIQSAFIMGGNLYEATPDTNWAAEALNNIGLKIYLTTTLNRGHVHGVDSGETWVLPVTARDEEWQSTTQESMFNYVRLSDGGIQRIANPRPEVAIICDIAERVLGNDPVDFKAFQSHRHIREAIAKIIPGMEELASIDVAKKEFHVSGRIMHSPQFHTQTNKANFIAHDWQKLQDGVRQEENNFGGVDDYPYRLMSVRSEGQFNSIVYEENDSYRGATGRWVVFMGEQDLAKLHVSAGERVTLRSPHGVMKNVQVCQFDLPEGNLMAYYPEANILIGRSVDPRSKTPAFKSVVVDIEKADGKG